RLVRGVISVVCPSDLGGAASRRAWLPTIARLYPVSDRRRHGKPWVQHRRCSTGLRRREPQRGLRFGEPRIFWRDGDSALVGPRRSEERRVGKWVRTGS